MRNRTGCFLIIWNRSIEYTQLYLKEKCKHNLTILYLTACYSHSLHISNPIKSLSERIGVNRRNYAAIPQSLNSSPIFLRYTWYFIDTQLICGVNITYGYVFTNLKALGHYSTHPSDVEVYWKVTGVLPIWFPRCSWKVMNLIIFRHHNKYTHPVLYMPANITIQGMGRVEIWVKLLYTDLSHRAWEGLIYQLNSFTQTFLLCVEGNLEKRGKKNLKNQLLILIFSSYCAGFNIKY